MPDLFLKNAIEHDPDSSIKPKSITKNWNMSEWEKYLSAIETPNDKEVIYVGTSIDLENYMARKFRKK